VIIEIDGRPVTDPRRDPRRGPYGHFTALQVRGRSTRGLDLHLERLDGANRELFGAGIDRDEVLARIGHALGDVEDASVRVYKVAREQGEGTSTVVTVRPPGAMPAAGLPSRRASVRLADLPDYRAAFVTNARGIAPVARIDDVEMVVDTHLMETLASVYEAVPRDRIA
jgi:branched-subunit amino acid aminotransferase/4-amino-4-deoxychorismate lyase